MKLAIYAGSRQYAQHLLPVWRALPEESRYPFLCTQMSVDYVSANLSSGEWAIGRPGAGIPSLVAGFIDYQHIGGGRPVAFLEHGCGQSYLGEGGIPDLNPANPGGNDREGISLYLNPNARVAELNTRQYTYATSIVIGSPWLDHLQSVAKVAKNVAPKNPKITPRTNPAIAIAFHWPNPQTIESSSAFNHFRPGLPKLAESFTVLGHGHPRAWDHLLPHYQSAGIEPVKDFADIVRRADILAVDNSSIGPEFAAATNRPLVWLNDPSWRRNVSHGGRFWDWPEGQIQCDYPELLPDAITTALADSPPAKESRARMISSIWAYTDGKASIRAAKALLEWMNKHDGQVNN